MISEHTGERCQAIRNGEQCINPVWMLFEDLPQCLQCIEDSVAQDIKRSSAMSDERRAQLERELAELNAEEARDRWAEQEMTRYSSTEQRRILNYLLKWIKKQIGHGQDCNCGECD